MNRQIQITRPEPSRFDYLRKLLRQDNVTKLRDFVDGRLSGPLIVEFDPTTACNFSCPECISADLLNQDSISESRIKDLIEEFSRAGVQGVIFIGGGEPLAHKAMPRPIRWTYEHGMAVGLTTNGSLIERHMDTLAECVHWTRVSMDAGTPETFQLFRPNKMKDAFASILRAMEALSKKKKGALGYSFLVMQRRTPAGMISNVTEIFEAARIAKDTGCDYFEYKPMVDTIHYLVPFDAEFNKIIREQHELCLTLRDRKFDIIAPRSITHLAEKENPVQPKAYTQCPAMELRTLVTPSGIYPCPYMRGRADKKLGSVDDGPFDEFWISGARKEAARKTNPSVDCQFYCIRHHTNVFMDAMQSLEEQKIPVLSHLQHADESDVFF